MLDYRGLEALHTVLEVQSFEAAAKKLRLTQSAVSQRIKALEIHYGEPLLIRTLPYHPTELGKELIRHFKHLSLLEEELEKNISFAESIPRISIALNRDSLETWFYHFIEEKELFGKILLEIIADDQELTIQYLKNGLVSACLSTSSAPISGGEAHFLGNMEYVLAASLPFAEIHFSKNNFKQALRKAPAIKFDRNDKLHERYLEKFFGLKEAEIKFHVMPSVKGFKKFDQLGYGCALLPKIEIEEELKRKQLISLFPDKVWKVPLYWHNWKVQPKFYREFNTAVIRYAKKALEN